MGRTGPNRDFFGGFVDFFTSFTKFWDTNYQSVSNIIVYNVEKCLLQSLLGSFLRVPVPAVFSPVPSADPKTILYFIYFFFF